MKKFVFSLEGLQHTKRTQERELKKELAAIEARLNAELLALEHLQQEQGILRELWLARMALGLSANEIGQFSNSFSQLNEQARIRQAQIQKINQEKSQCQERLIRLLTEIKSLETLKEQQFALYRQESEKEAAKEIDDFVVGRLKQNSQGIG